MTPLKIRKLDPSRKALTQRCSASREPASWRVGQFAFALLISLCAKPGQAFTPVAQLDITDAVDTNIIEIGRIQNVDFYFADSPIPQPDDTLQGYLKNAEPTGIVVGTYPFKSPSSVTWVGLILNNKSRHSKLYFDDFAQRPPGIIDIFQRSTDGALTKLPLAEDQTVKIAGRSYGLNLEKGEKTTIFVRIKSKSFEQLNLGIGSESSLIISGQRRSFWYGLVSASTFFILALQISLLIAKRGLPQILGLARLIVTALFSMSAYGLNLRFFGDGSIMIPRELTMSLLQLGSLIFVSFVCVNFWSIQGFRRHVKTSWQIIILLVTAEFLIIATTSYTQIDVSALCTLFFNVVAISLLIYLARLKAPFALAHLGALFPIFAHITYELLQTSEYSGIGIYSELIKTSLLAIGTLLCSLVMVWQHLQWQTNETRTLTLNEESSALKNLINTLSHDLATPIFNISASVLSARKAAGPESIIRNELGFIERSALQLTEIVDHVRKASAIRDGKIQLALASVALLEVFDATLSNFSRKLEEKNLQLHFDRERVKGFCVMADKTALTHSVIYNIVSNSIKFSEKGAQINLSVDATSEEQVCITIQDQGIGIPKSMLPVLFSSTSKTSRSGTIGEQGTGYGMPLVKAYVLLFNGKIEVDSVTNVENPVRHGTTIRITLAPGKSSRESIHDIGGRIV